MLLFTYYSLSSADYPAEPCCPRRNHRTTGPPTATRLPRTHMPGGSKGGQHRPLSHPNSWEWRAMLLPVSSTSWMMMLRATAPASATWRLATVRPRSALWRTLQDSRRWLRSLGKLTPLRTRVRGPSRLRKHTPRNYDNDGRTSRRRQYIMNEGNDLPQFA